MTARMGVGILLLVLGILAMMGAVGLFVIDQINASSTMPEVVEAEFCEPGEHVEVRTRMNDMGRVAGQVYICIDAAGNERDVTAEIPLTATFGTAVIALFVGSMVLVLLGVVMMALGGRRRAAVY